ncbi:alpha/beta fold hydrolase [Novosphingobium terrae]|uniref:alpha/beta fold hydrolase n=1 Tax=Novosphingobium terrae TaxID=2726189 RepID=UPI00197DFCEF|nr:alpha/beta hydrolase [Novosphingobium terrae]
MDKFITVNDVRLRVVDQGEGAPALVFLHYWGGSASTWAPLIAALGSGRRSIALDQRGWGQSDAPASYALADMAEDAQGVIAALGLERYVLIGHSMGGKVAQLLASRCPTGLAGLVLVAPSPPTPLGLPLEVRQGMVHAYDSRESVIATVQHALTGTPLNPEQLEQVIADSLAGSAPARKAWPMATSQENIAEQVAHIAVPVLVIAGEQDRVDPPAVLEQELLPHIKQARMHVLPGVGHLSPVEAPEALASLIRDFVETLAVTSAA